MIGIGGFLGSVLRHLVGGYIQQATKSVGFPYGTLAVNLIGCFAIGFLFLEG
jgi:CrcB protein